MWFAILLVILTPYVAKAAPDPVYQSCADEWIKPDNDFGQRILCQASRFDYDGYRPNPMKEFLDCTFFKAGWMDKNTRMLNVAKLAADLKALGFPDRQAQIAEIESWCKFEFRNNLCARNYWRCLTEGRHAIRELPAMVRKRDSEFFSKNHCVGVEY